jgi:hypothetical protein
MHLAAGGAPVAVERRAVEPVYKVKILPVSFFLTLLMLAFISINLLLLVSSCYIHATSNSHTQ